MSDRIAINSSYVEQIASLIEVNNFTELNLIITDLHIADIAEIIEDLSIENAHFLFNLIEEEKSASVLVELEDDTREEILSDLTAKEIAEGVIDNLESDDAADVIGELSENKKEEVNGEFTGKVSGVPSFREGKIKRLESWLSDKGLKLTDFDKTYFYSDSKNDIPLLEKVSNPVVVNADDELMSLAKKRKWPSINLR